MDTRTGELYGLASDESIEDFLKHFSKVDRQFIKPIERELTPLENNEKKIGRNSPCGCGSNKKFKNCCWTGKHKIV